MEVNFLGIFVTLAITQYRALLRLGAGLVLVVKSAMDNDSINTIGIALGITASKRFVYWFVFDWREAFFKAFIAGDMSEVLKLKKYYFLMGHRYDISSFNNKNTRSIYQTSVLN